MRSASAIAATGVLCFRLGFVGPVGHQTSQNISGIKKALSDLLCRLFNTNQHVLKQSRLEKAFYLVNAYGQTKGTRFTYFR